MDENTFNKINADGKKTFCFDIDRTICEPVSCAEEYATTKPITKMIAFINELYGEGHTIFFYTGRHALQVNVTKKWLKEQGVKYHHLFLGKPVADVYIDDLAVRYTNVDDVKAQLKDISII